MNLSALADGTSRRAPFSADELLRAGSVLILPDGMEFDVTYTFEFALGQVVVTTLGDRGIVDMLGVDRGGMRFYVKMGGTGQWYGPDELELVLDEPSGESAE